MSSNKDKLNILHITDSFHPEAGGVERVIENLGASQVEMGHRVFVFTKSIPGESFEDNFRGMEVFRYRRKERPTLLNYYSSISGSKKLFSNFLVNHKIDLLHSHLTLSSYGPISIAKSKNIPVVASFYGPWDKEFLAESKELMDKFSGIYKNYLAFQMKLQRKLQSSVLKNADRLIVLSDHSRSEGERLFSGSSLKTTKIPGGIDKNRFSKGKPSHSFRKELGIAEKSLLIFTLRRLVRRMGVDILIEAFANCVEKGIDGHLLIGGTGPLEDTLKKQGKKCSARDRIHFLGYVPDKRLADAYREMDLVVMPTRDEENFGLPILEAVACGTPVIGTPVGSIPEILGYFSSEMVTEKPTSDSIAEKIIWSISNLPELKKSFADYSDKARTEWSWSKIAQQTDELYFKVVR